MRGEYSPATKRLIREREAGLKARGRVSIARAAAIAKRAPGTIHGWVRLGKVAWEKSAGKVYVSEADVRAIVAGERNASAA